MSEPRFFDPRQLGGVAGESEGRVTAAQASQVLSRHGVGASEIAAACGISRYRSRFGLWLEKTGRVPGFAGNIHTRLGSLCEPRARQLFSNATGLDVEIPPCSEFHPEVAWARCTPDGRVVGNPKHLVQIKSVGYFVHHRWHGQVPLEYEAQCMWECFVTGAERVDLAVLVGSEELEWERFLLGDLTDPQEIFDRATLRIYPIYRDDVGIASLLKGAAEFMRLVETDTQPPIDASPECTAWLNRRAGGRVELDYADPEVITACDEYHEAYVENRAITKRLDLAKNHIRDLMGAAKANRIQTPSGAIQWIAKRDGSTQLRAPDAWGKETSE